MTVQRQQRLQKGAGRWEQMSPGQRDLAKQRFKRWQELTPEQRATLRERYEKFTSLPPEQQERMRKRLQWFRELPADKRQALREKWRGMSQEERAAFRERRRERLERRSLQEDD